MQCYAFEPDMLITFDICPEDDIEDNIVIWVDVQTPTVLPLCKFLNHIYVFDIVYSKIVDNYFLLSAYFRSSKHVQRLVDMTYYCPRAELNCEELSHLFHGLRILIPSRQIFFLDLEILVLKTCNQ